MPTPSSHDGPLHLQGHLTDCTEPLAKAIRGAVQHAVSSTKSICCTCRRSGALKALDEAQRSGDPQRSKSASERLALLQRRTGRASPGGSDRLVRVPGPAEEALPHERRLDCRLFAIELNEEEGVLRGYCRRCQKLFVIFDRALYWGVRRDPQAPPEVFPYRCSCGGHTFEAGVGFDYPEDAFDENDIHTITIAVRCAACDEISVILDEEAT